MTRYNYCNIMSPCHWFQFADDSALVTSIEEDSQVLLNVFTKWSAWASLIIKVNVKPLVSKNMAAN